VQEAGVAITTSPCGTLHFGVEYDVQKAREAALLLQNSLKGHEAEKELENLGLLQSMGIEVCTPFVFVSLYALMTEYRFLTLVLARYARSATPHQRLSLASSLSSFWR